MTRTTILPPDAPLVDRLRTHAARLVEDQATAINGLGYSTEKWEKEDLEHVLDLAADAIESKEGE